MTAAVTDPELALAMARGRPAALPDTHSAPPRGGFLLPRRRAAAAEGGCREAVARYELEGRGWRKVWGKP